MSQVYATEPQTSGLVVLETTAGPLSIHLWCKECPHTVRYFLQLCIDGFYDNLVFHRVVPNFLIQTGDANFRQSVNSSSNSNNSNSNSSNSNSNRTKSNTKSTIINDDQGSSSSVLHLQ
uniref:PPIase cyclophilin-type domain-containing protein n=1 Tax=Pseudo-nitzschia australis TaxID=44445 RepID=A0A7S4AJQ9_9STRA